MLTFTSCSGVAVVNVFGISTAAPTIVWTTLDQPFNVFATAEVRVGAGQGHSYSSPLLGRRSNCPTAGAGAQEVTGVTGRSFWAPNDHRL
jgi:hypothetical protein